MFLNVISRVRPDFFLLSTATFSFYFSFAYDQVVILNYIKTPLEPNFKLFFFEADSKKFHPQLRN